MIFGLTVLHTPGHASDHLCFARPDGVLFSGDHVMSWNSSIVSPPDGNMRDYCTQLSRLLDRNDKVYLPGHGPAITDPRPYVERLLANRMRREAEILAHMSYTADSIPRIAASVYRKTDPHIAWAAARNVAAHLEKLLSEGPVIRDGELWHGRRPGPDQIAHRRIAAIRLYPVASLHRDQRGRYHDAVMPHLDNLAIKAVATGACFITEVQPPTVCRQHRNNFAYVIGTMRNCPPVTDLAAAFSVRNDNRGRRLMDIEPNKPAILQVVSPPFVRLGARQPGATLERRMPWERPPAQSAHAAIMGSNGRLFHLRQEAVRKGGNFQRGSIWPPT